MAIPFQEAFASAVATSRLMAQQRAMEVTAHNMANANTPGFRASRVQFSDWLSKQTGTSAPPGEREIAYVQDRATWREERPGPIGRTGNPLDLAIGDVQGAQFVPALGVVPEKANRGGLAALEQAVEPGAIGGDAGMLGIEAADELAHQGGIVAAGGQAEAGELGFAETLEEAGFDEQFQVA